MPKNQVCQELPRERKRWIRPPLIGQASAAEHSVPVQAAGTNKGAITQTVTDGAYRSLPEYSNSWSGVHASAFQHLHSETNLAPPLSQPLSFPTRGATNNCSASTHIMGQQRHGILRVTEDACGTVHSGSKVTKENKSELSTVTCLQDGGATNEVSATIPDSPNARAPSPASVSSVTSSRRLEWDSGADVGYLPYQISDEISVSGHDMSTIERIALAQGCSAALSMRLDPEGTLCSGQASSTLLVSNQIKTHKNSHQIEHYKTLSATDSTRIKYIDDSATTSAESENGVTPTLLKSNDSKSDYVDSSVDKTNNMLQRVNSDKNGKFVSDVREQQHENGMQVKKLSSSLSSLNELEFQNRKDLNILHRSQSQNSVSREYIDQKADPSSYLSLPQKNSNAVTNSLSSSSLATVVSNKQDYRKTSNKRTQTSPHASIKQSIAIQVYNDKHAIQQDFPEKGDKTFQNKHSYFEHAGSTDHSEMILEKTFDTEKSIVGSGCGRSKQGSAKAVVSEQLKTAFQKQTLLSACQETVNSSESRNSTESDAFVMHREVSNVKISQGNNVSTNHVPSTNQDLENPSPIADNLQADSSWFLNDETFVEKNRFNDTSQRGSMDALDSAQSFEYLPGHVFENMTKITMNKDVIKELSSSVLLQQENLNDTSSESLPSNTFAKDLDKIVTLVTSYLGGRPHSSREKKRLVQKIVKRLLETKYTDDSSSRESHVPSENGTIVMSHNNRVAGEISNETGSIKRSDFNCKKPQKPIKHVDRKLQAQVHQTPVHLSDKCIGTAFSEESALPSSTSESAALEIPVSSSTDGTVYATGPISTTTSTSSKSNSVSWKRHSVRLEREYELCKQDQKQNHSQSVLLNFCKTERENQLSWICTEIRHLKRLKQLLENQERLLEEIENKTKLQGVKDKSVKSLYSSPADSMSTETSHAKSRRFLETYSTTSTDQEISTGKRNAILNNIHRSREMYKVCDFNTAKAHRKLYREGKYLQMKSSKLENVSEIQDKVSVSKEKAFEKPNLYTQEYVEKLREEINTKISKDEGIQTSLRSNSSSSFRTYVMSEKSENHSSSGRINVYIQTKDKTSAIDGLKDFKVSEGSKIHKFNSEMPLCCCECKKLCEQVKEKLIGRSETCIVRQSKCRCSQAAPHETADDKLSSYGTLNDAAELTKDSECHAQISSLKGTRVLKKAENAGVQTTLSFREEFIGRCDKIKQTHTEDYNRETFCLCHKLIKSGLFRELESQVQKHLGQKSAVQQESLKDEEKLSSSSDQKINYHKTKELKTEGGHTSKKCTLCSTSISESSRSKHKENQLYNSCYQKTSSSSSTSIISSSELPNKEPIAYILTLESASEISIPEKIERKHLEEIVIKVPVKKKSQTDATGKKKQAKQKKTDSLSKENHRPKHKMCSDNSENSETTNGLESLTLQEYLMINRPDFIESAEQRRSCLDELARMRELHQKSKRERLAVAAHVNSTAMKDMKDLPRPPLAIKRVFSQRTMRAQTEQKYRKLPEMQVKKVERKRKEEFRTNRLMAQIFAKKLQKKALRGEVSLSNSKSVISTL